MTASYQLTADDLLQAIRGAHRKGWPRRFLRSVAIMTAAGIGGAVVVATMRGKADSLPAVIARVWPDLLLLVVLIVVGCTALNHWWFIPRAAKRLFEQMKSIQLRMELSIEAHGLRFRDVNNDSLIPWDHIRMWRETPGYLLIYLTDAYFLVVPKRALADAMELDQLKAMLVRRSPPT